MSDTCELEKPEEGSVTGWLYWAKSGDEVAVSNLCERYFGRLADLARARFGSASRTTADEEDIANSVLATLFEKVAKGVFPNLLDRDDLWSLLISITKKKVASQIRSNLRQKRGGGQVMTMTDVQADAASAEDLDAFSQPSHETMAMISDLCSNMVERLDDPALREIAVLKLAGYNNREIADRLGRLPKAIDRKVAIIREIWLLEFPGELDCPSSVEPPAN